MFQGVGRSILGLIYCRYTSMIEMLQSILMSFLLVLWIYISERERHWAWSA